MEPIVVPGPSRSAFNKNRPPSDLLVSQLKYFQHMEEKHEFGLDPVLARDIGTEAGAARYIAAMTRTIRREALAAGRGTLATERRKLVPTLMAKPLHADRSKGGLKIAAAAELPQAILKSTSSKKDPKASKVKTANRKKS